MDWLNGQGLGKNKIGKVIRKTFWRSIADRSLQMGEGCDDTCAPCKCSSEVTSAEEFNNQEVEMTPSVDHQPLSPVILIEWGMIL